MYNQSIMWKRIVTIVALVVALLVVSFLVQNSNQNTAEAPILEENTEEEMIFESLVVKHQYKDGQHVFIGDIELPNPCHNYNATITDSEDSNVKNIMIEYSPNESDVCTQVITNVTWRAVYEGEENLEFQAFENGVQRRLNIFEVSEDVDIDDFEIFIKG